MCSGVIAGGTELVGNTRIVISYTISAILLAIVTFRAGRSQYQNPPANEQQLIHEAITIVLKNISDANQTKFSCIVNGNNGKYLTVDGALSFLRIHNYCHESDLPKPLPSAVVLFINSLGTWVISILFVTVTGNDAQIVWDSFKRESC